MSALDISNALAGEGVTAPTGRRCKYGRLLDAVPADQAAELDARLHGHEWSDARLAKLIRGTAFGYISQALLSNHRNAVCICDDTTTDSKAA